MHNETSWSHHDRLTGTLNIKFLAVNIHSHLLGTALAALGPIYFYKATPMPLWKMERQDLLAVGAFILGAIVCFLFSTVYARHLPISEIHHVDCAEVPYFGQP